MTLAVWEMFARFGFKRKRGKRRERERGRGRGNEGREEDQMGSRRRRRGFVGRLAVSPTHSLARRLPRKKKALSEMDGWEVFPFFFLSSVCG